MLFPNMFPVQLRLNILLGICVFVCVFSVFCTDGMSINEKNVHVQKKPKADESVENINDNPTEILRANRAAPKATTPKANKPLVKSACEKSKLQVSCPAGKVIHFLQASYGRKTLAKCNPNKNKKFNVKCKSNKSDKVMREKCHLKRSCTVEASNSVFGDPCVKTIKYLEMQYRCVTVKVTTKITNIKKTTPKAITPKKVVTTKIPLTKGTTQREPTSKVEETTMILETKRPTVRDTTSQDTSLLTTPIDNTPKDITTILDTTPEIIAQTTTETIVEETTTPSPPPPPPTTTIQPPTVPSTTTTEVPIPTSAKARVTAPDTDCDENDVDCIIDDLGEKPDWFVCESDMGSYPHPTSKKIFIFCLNWKPKVKKCGQDLVFSEDHITCVSP